MTMKEIFATCLLGAVKFDGDKAKKCKRNDIIIKLLNKTKVDPDKLIEKIKAL